MIIAPKLRAAPITWFIRGAISPTRCADSAQVCVSHMSQMTIAVRATGHSRTCSVGPPPLVHAARGDAACRALSGGSAVHPPAARPAAGLRGSKRGRIVGRRIVSLSASWNLSISVSQSHGIRVATIFRGILARP
jgi:hypothetical protein